MKLSEEEMAMAADLKTKIETLITDSKKMYGAFVPEKTKNESHSRVLITVLEPFKDKVQEAKKFLGIRDDLLEGVELRLHTEVLKKQVQILMEEVRSMKKQLIN